LLSRIRGIAPLFFYFAISVTEQEAKELIRRLERQADTNQGLGWRLSVAAGGAGLGAALGSQNSNRGSAVLGAILGGAGAYGSAYLSQLLLKRLEAKDKLRRKTLYGVLGALSGAGAGFSAGLIRKDENSNSKPLIPAAIGAAIGGLAGWGYGSAADSLEDKFLLNNGENK
jgi:hypothetical protein